MVIYNVNNYTGAKMYLIRRHGWLTFDAKMVYLYNLAADDLRQQGKFDAALHCNFMALAARSFQRLKHVDPLDEDEAKIKHQVEQMLFDDQISIMANPAVLGANSSLNIERFKRVANRTAEDVGAMAKQVGLLMREVPLDQYTLADATPVLRHENDNLSKRDQNRLDRLKKLVLERYPD